MVMVESQVTSWLYDRKSEFDLLVILRKPLAIVLFVTEAVRVDVVALEPEPA